MVSSPSGLSTVLACLGDDVALHRLLGKRQGAPNGRCGWVRGGSACLAQSWRGHAWRGRVCGGSGARQRAQEGFGASSPWTQAHAAAFCVFGATFPELGHMTYIHPMRGLAGGMGWGGASWCVPKASHQAHIQSAHACSTVMTASASRTAALARTVPSMAAGMAAGSDGVPAAAAAARSARGGGGDELGAAAGRQLRRRKVVGIPARHVTAVGSVAGVARRLMRGGPGRSLL